MNENNAVQQLVFEQAQKVLNKLLQSKTPSELVSQQYLLKELDQLLTFLEVQERFKLPSQPFENVSDKYDEDVNKKLSQPEEIPTTPSEKKAIIKETNISPEDEAKDLTMSALDDTFSKKPQESTAEQKFKLANIKGLANKDAKKEACPSPLSSTFQEDEEDRNDKAPATNRFRLDLNDKIAFQKKLFKGDDAFMKKTIDALNSFDDIDKARDYLSEVYYANDWEEVDEYAQRLWGLVENKFL